MEHGISSPVPAVRQGLEILHSVRLEAGPCARRCATKGPRCDRTRKGSSAGKGWERDQAGQIPSACFPVLHLEALRAWLRELGNNILIESGRADGEYDRLPDLVDGLISWSGQGVNRN
jgi:hypothetical protein